MRQQPNKTKQNVIKQGKHPHTERQDKATQQGGKSPKSKQMTQRHTVLQLEIPQKHKANSHNICTSGHSKDSYVICACCFSF